MRKYLLSLVLLCLLISGCNQTPKPSTSLNEINRPQLDESNLQSIRDSKGYSFEVNGNEPYFDEEELTTDVFEEYSSLDSLGRCGVAYANICPELMPTEERGEIGQIKPSGWQTIKYDNIDGKYLYNRCHLIGFQLAGENDNECNLVTGTRQMNVSGMLPYENQVADYVQETGNHVLYRVTPDFVDEELVCRGVLIEAKSVEDDELEFCVYCPNKQEGIKINYTDGSSQLFEGEDDVALTDVPVDTSYTNDDDVYVLNNETMVYHRRDCSYTNRISAKNIEISHSSAAYLEDEGYEPCGSCKP